MIPASNLIFPTLQVLIYFLVCDIVVSRIFMFRIIMYAGWLLYYLLFEA